MLHTTSEVRDRIQDDFLSLLQRRKSDGPPIDVTCLHETLQTGTFIIVPRDSAVLRGYNSISCHADHRDIVRFNKQENAGFLAIVAELRRWMEQFAMEYGEVGGIDPRQVRRCVESLKFSQLHSRQAAIERAASDTCAWILDNSWYRAWMNRRELDTSHGLLWIKGKPGSGKSTLMKFLCEKTSALPGSVRLLFFLNARGAELEKIPLGLYRSLLLQLVINKQSRPAMKSFFARLDEKEEVFGEGKYAWQLTELQDSFHDVVVSGGLPPLELFVDALDECAEDQVRRFVRLVGISAEKALARGLTLNVCWSSRHYPHISTKYSFELHLEDQNSSDIRRFVHQELSACDSLGAEVDFEQQIVARAHGVFLWASIVVQKLVRAADKGLPVKSLLELLWKLPTELDELLRDIFHSIERTFRSDTIHLIQWMLFAERPLYVEEVDLALAFSAYGSSPSHLDDFSASLRNKRMLSRKRHQLVGQSPHPMLARKI